MTTYILGTTLVTILKMDHSGSKGRSQNITWQMTPKEVAEAVMDMSDPGCIIKGSQ
jgi:hypothetical protein